MGDSQGGGRLLWEVYVCEDFVVDVLVFVKVRLTQSEVHVPNFLDAPRAILDFIFELHQENVPTYELPLRVIERENTSNGIVFYAHS